MFLSRFLSLLLLLTLFSSCHLGRFENKKPVNIQAVPSGIPPAFSLVDLHGKKHALSDYAGKTVLVHFWATWCVPCLAEIHELADLRKTLIDESFEVIAISVDRTPGPVREFVRRQRIDLPVLLDLPGIVQRKYRALEIPRSFLVSPYGELLTFYDPLTDSSVPFAAGPREWNSPAYHSMLRSVISSRGQLQ